MENSFLEGVATEDALKVKLESVLEKDFYLHSEVSGINGEYGKLCITRTNSLEIEGKSKMTPGKGVGLNWWKSTRLAYILGKIDWD